MMVVVMVIKLVHYASNGDICGNGDDNDNGENDG